MSLVSIHRLSCCCVVFLSTVSVQFTVTLHRHLYNSLKAVIQVSSENMVVGTTQKVTHFHIGYRIWGIDLMLSESDSS